MIPGILARRAWPHALQHSIPGVGAPMQSTTGDPRHQALSLSLTPRAFFSSLNLTLAIALILTLILTRMGASCARVRARPRRSLNGPVYVSMDAFNTPMDTFNASMGLTLYCTNDSMQRAVYFAPLWCQVRMLKQNATPKQKSPHKPMTIGNTTVVSIGDYLLLLRKWY